MGKRHGAAAMVAALMLTSMPARAATVWVGAETHVPFEGLPRGFPSLLRFYSESDLTDASSLHGLKIRVGPLWDVTDWLQGAANVVTQASRSEGTLSQRLTGELDLSLHHRLGSLGVSGRTRLAHEWQGEHALPWLVRNQLRLTVGQDVPWRPFVYDELSTRPGEGLVSQNTLGFGLRWALSEALRLDFGAELEARPTGDTSWSGGLTLFYAPDQPALTSSDIPAF